MAIISQRHESNPINKKTLLKKMARAILLKENDNERIYELSNGKTMTIRINDQSEISYLEDGEEIGNYEDFVFIEDEFDSSKYLLARMYVPIKGQGLGRATNRRC